MNSIKGPATNAYNNAVTSMSNARKHVADSLDKTQKSVGAKIDKFSETKAGKGLLSFVGCVKKVCNAPVQLVRNHPKATIAAGIVVTLIGGFTANLPAMGVGISLLAVGALAQSANRHAQMKEAAVTIQQQEMPQPEAGQAKQSHVAISHPEITHAEIPYSGMPGGSYSYTFQKA